MTLYLLSVTSQWTDVRAHYTKRSAKDLEFWASTCCFQPPLCSSNPLSCMFLLFSPNLSFPPSSLSLATCIGPSLSPRGWQSCVGSGRARLTQPRRSWVVTARSHPKVWHSSWQTARPNSAALNNNCECVCVWWKNSKLAIKVNMKNVQMILSHFTIHKTVSCYSATRKEQIRYPLL